MNPVLSAVALRREVFHRFIRGFFGAVEGNEADGVLLVVGGFHRHGTSCILVGLDFEFLSALHQRVQIAVLGREGRGDRLVFLALLGRETLIADVLVASFLETERP